jgi:hypothetical protein
MFHEHSDWLEIEKLVDRIGGVEIGALLDLARRIEAREDLVCLFEMSSEGRGVLLSQLRQIAELEEVAVCS